MVGPTGFHQNIETFVLDDAERPHTLSYPLDNFHAIGFAGSLSRDKGYEGEFLPSFLFRVISM
jgi:hypothetical protein